MTFFTEFFRKNLAYLIKSKGLTQKDVATAVGVTSQAVHKWMQPDGSPPSTRNLTKLSSYFDVPENDLISVDLENAGIAQDPAAVYGNDRVALHIKRMNLKLEEIIQDNNQALLRLSGK
ncbi:MAG TPA: helix-turn-helix transcriptional regulator [Saprospiraceae bacterium]|nr:helix-turn-helix transcriptional regulator [Saprospiraceae bacterium]